MEQTIEEEPSALLTRKMNHTNPTALDHNASSASFINDETSQSTTRIMTRAMTRANSIIQGNRVITPVPQFVYKIIIELKFYLRMSFFHFENSKNN